MNPDPRSPLDANPPLFVLDDHGEGPVVMMASVPGDEPNPAVEMGLHRVIARFAPGAQSY